jgi:epoxide hydrolase-like predicted phosphatase
MAAEIKAILFDIGGVIVRTDDPAPRVRLAARFGLDRAGIDQLVFGSPIAQAAERGEAEEAAVWAHVQRELALTPEALAEFQSEFWRGDKADAALIDLLHSLRGAYRTGLLTNSWLREPLSLFWTRFGLSEAVVRGTFDVVVSSAAVGVQKPDARVYQAALTALGTKAEETVFVDDFAHNIQAARALGLQAVHFTGADQARRELMAILQK